MKKICKGQDCENEVRGKGEYCSYQCAFPVIREAIEQLKKREGPVYDKWKTRLKASMEKL